MPKKGPLQLSSPPSPHSQPRHHQRQRSSVSPSGGSGTRPSRACGAFAPLLHSYCMTGVVAEQLQAEMRTLTLEHPR